MEKRASSLAIGRTGWYGVPDWMVRCRSTEKHLADSPENCLGMNKLARYTAVLHSKHPRPEAGPLLADRKRILSATTAYLSASFSLTLSTIFHRSAVPACGRNGAGMNSCLHTRVPAVVAKWRQSRHLPCGVGRHTLGRQQPMTGSGAAVS